MVAMQNKNIGIIIKPSDREEHRKIRVLDPTGDGPKQVARPVTIVTVAGEVLTDVRLRDVTLLDGLNTAPGHHHPIVGPDGKPLAMAAQPDFIIGPDGETLHEILEVETTPKYYDAARDLLISPATYVKFLVSVGGLTCKTCQDREAKPGYVVAAYAEGEPNVFVQCQNCRHYMGVVLVRPKGADDLRPYLKQEPRE
jgi:hypothetical protein